MILLLPGLPRPAAAGDYPFGDNLGEWRQLQAEFDDDWRGVCRRSLGPGTGAAWVRASSESLGVQQVTSYVNGIRVIVWMQADRAWAAFPRFDLDRPIADPPIGPGIQCPACPYEIEERKRTEPERQQEIRTEIERREALPWERVIALRPGAVVGVDLCVLIDALTQDHVRWLSEQPGAAERNRR